MDGIYEVFFLISSKSVTVSSEYKRSPQCRQTSALTFMITVLTPLLRGFSTFFSASSLPQMGHFSNGFVCVIGSFYRSISSIEVTSLTLPDFMSRSLLRSASIVFGLLRISIESVRASKLILSVITLDWIVSL